MELETLIEQQHELWLLIEQKSPEADSKALFNRLQTEFNQLLRSNNEVEIRYECMRFCVRYMKQSEDYDFIIMRSLFSDWQATFRNENFPLDLLNDLLNTVNNHTFDFFDISQVSQLADRLYENQQYAIAKLYYERIESKLDSSNSWNNWANCYAKDEDFENALDILSKGVQQVPDSDHIANNRAYYLMRLSQFDAALQQLSEVIERAEKYKYNDDYFYSYAIALKADIYQHLDMPLYAYMEKSRLLTTNNSEPSEIIQSSKEMLEQAKSL